MFACFVALLTGFAGFWVLLVAAWNAADTAAAIELRERLHWPVVSCVARAVRAHTYEVCCTDYVRCIVVARCADSDVVAASYVEWTRPLASRVCNLNRTALVRDADDAVLLRLPPASVVAAPLTSVDDRRLSDDDGECRACAEFGSERTLSDAADKLGRVDSNVLSLIGGLMLGIPLCLPVTVFVVMCMRVHISQAVAAATTTTTTTEATTLIDRRFNATRVVSPRLPTTMTMTMTMMMRRRRRLRSTQ